MNADVRQSVFDQAVSINTSFITLNDDDKLSFILSKVSIARFSTETCNDILNICPFILSMKIMCSCHMIDTYILSIVHGEW